MGEWFRVDGDDFDPDEFDVPEIKFDSVVTDTVVGMARAEAERVERAIRGAIHAGYDGVDVNRSDPMEGVGIASIEPWNRPAPGGANGYMTERYTWDWFSDDELTEILRADDPLSLLGSEGDLSL